METKTKTKTTEQQTIFFRYSAAKYVKYGEFRKIEQRIAELSDPDNSTEARFPLSTGLTDMGASVEIHLDLHQSEFGEPLSVPQSAEILFRNGIITESERKVLTSATPEPDELIIFLD